jgi:hypothetical protein
MVSYPDLSATSTLGGNTSLIKTDLDSSEPRGDIAFDSSEVDAICHFFNILNASSEDKMFLLIARRHGFAEATRLQVGLKWKCEATARKVYNLVNGDGVE